MSAESDRLRIEEPTLWVRRQVIPFAIFMGFLLLLQVAGGFFAVDLPSQPWWRRAPEHWIYPLQTVVCLVVLVRWWRSYEFRWSLRWSLIGAVFGVVGIGFWVLPTHLFDLLSLTKDGWWKWFGFAPRRDGFNPSEVFMEGGAAWWTSLIFRFVRAAVVVALVEEIFWRSFVMRLVVDWDGDYWKQPFGKPSWLSFAVVAGLFMAAHRPVDYFGAFIYGALTYVLCIWSRNLGACVVMHFVANLLMGLYAMGFGKYGLW
ncbi:CAAX prenyl protease-related protein [Haloferula sp. A504]|uniref:CAAX prenyl protease-related protein n=1 Tax=Haloferula sp. A504 TaxID=3373601 RepID=UPI0031C02C26|nr:CAAX prenyl protease-related protein [Verrucomicrobiaceae bacterium E54]